MERYTEKVDGIWSVSCKYEEPPYPVVTQEVIDRLASYEDTGLEPEEIKAALERAQREFEEYDEMAPKGRLRELVQADREGRCVVTPPDPATESDYEIICRTINPEYIHLRKVFEK